MAHVSEKKFPLDPKDYRLYEEIGEGVSAMVYRALCVPYNEIVAIKVIDLEKCDNDLDGIRREVHTLSLIYHPNVLHAHCSFILDTYLWVVMPYLSGGSCLHIMRFAYPDGFEELVIATLLREVLKALVYLHNQGRIHRDVKAGNILIGANGIVKLADFGVSASLFDAGDRRRARISFVGTPCWMAPEVMEQIHGYDIKADIWSFGITALELAHGHAPLSKYPPMKVLLLTLQSAPPGLDYERDRRFSKSFKEMIASCLVKDPAKRPSAERLLKHSFFKSARSNEYLARAILDGLAPLGERFRELKAKDAELLLQDMAVDGDKKHLSQQEYLRGISGWNFDLDELKAQAALIDASDTSSMTEELSKDMHGSGTIEASDIVHSENVSGSKSALLREGEPFGSRDLEDSLSFSFPMLPLRALKECFDVSEDVISPSTPDLKDATRPYVSQAENLESETHEGVAQERSSSVLPNIPGSDLPKDFSPLFLPAHGIDLSKDATNDVERRGDDQEHGLQYGRNFSIPMVNRQRRDLRPQLINTLEEKLEERIVQQKGRFRVTAADASPKGDRSGKAQSIGFIGSGASSSTSAAFVVSSLRHILQQTGMQREQLAKLIKHIEQSPGQIINVGESSKRDVAQIPLSSMRERELQSYAGHLQRCNADLAEELQRLKTQNAQLERQLGALVSKKVGQRK